ncbi:MucR family transcriptional regulator [Litorimonas sp. RW-G-Af-16]|uniref:MucR family transcriptional regulator n=1 Tax=Litorimonas sp. RW-G-Af-16 TaxID=3241168 RepID=UPI00390C4352
MSELSQKQKTALLRHTSDIVSAIAGQGQVNPNDLPSLIQTVYDSLESAAYSEVTATPEVRPDPAVPIADSLRDDVIICLEDGQPFQSLKRHLRVKYNLTPDEYRQKWGLPKDYPMVAPDYAKRRSALAKRTGLGKNKR